MKPIATPSRTKEILEKHQLYTKKNYGQNFLIEPSVVEKIARSAIQTENTLAIEIGPGIGALTQYLCEYAKKVVAFEIDERLPEVLEDTLAAYPHVEIRLQDFLTTNIIEVVENFKNEGYDVVVAANLPYYITTPILFKLFESRAPIDTITVMMQKEVADRFRASTCSKDYNALSVITQYMCHVKHIMHVPSRVFLPKPCVDSAVLQFSFKENRDLIEDEQAFFAMVKACFKQKRKTMLNNYGAYIGDKQKAKQLLVKAEIAENARAESLSLEQFLTLYHVEQGSV